MIGSEKWLKYHELIEGLNLQAQFDLMQNEQKQVVIECFIKQPEKIGVMVHNLLAIEIWREKVFPILSDKCMQKAKEIYLIFFDEIVMINLLEQLFYNKEIIIAAGDAAVEMAGYCRRKLIQLVVRFFCTYIHDCTPFVSNLFLVDGDIIAILVELIINKPWFRIKDDMQWFERPPPDKFGKQQLLRTEIQVWMSLFWLICNDENFMKYQYDKAKGLQVRKVIKGLDINGLPDPKEKSNFLNKQITYQLRDQLMKNQNWIKIACNFESVIFSIQAKQPGTEFS
ncbi:MAG: putative Blu protein, partial [Streblomastix strix]